MINDSVRLVVLWRCTIIPWVECLLATRFACGSPRLYQFTYPMPFRSVSICDRSFVSFGLSVRVLFSGVVHGISVVRVV